MKPEQKGKRIGVGPLLAALVVLMLVAVLPGRAVLWAQSKGLAVEGKSVAGGERRLALVIGNAAYEGRGKKTSFQNSEQGVGRYILARHALLCCTFGSYAHKGRVHVCEDAACVLQGR